jgi:ubiquinone/menaquinone biosynthesis C-methylase UbiE
MDYDAALAELRRVMKPGGVFLHMFPPRTTPIEPHVFVPLATVVRSKAWLYMWALLGIRNQFQRGLSAAEVAESNRRYLLSSTNYLTRRQIVALFRRYFGQVRFAEAEYLRRSPRAAIRKIGKVPGAPAMYRWLRGYVIHGAAM